MHPQHHLEHRPQEPMHPADAAAWTVSYLAALGGYAAGAAALGIIGAVLVGLALLALVVVGLVIYLIATNWPELSQSALFWFLGIVILGSVAYVQFDNWRDRQRRRRPD